MRHGDFWAQTQLHCAPWRSALAVQRPTTVGWPQHMSVHWLSGKIRCGQSTLQVRYWATIAAALLWVALFFWFVSTPHNAASSLS